jgi:hypothetical protein
MTGWGPCQARVWLPLDHPTQAARPNDSENTAALANALNQFERHYNTIAEPFDWSLTRRDLSNYSTASTNAKRTRPLKLAAWPDHNCGEEHLGFQPAGVARRHSL